MFFKRPRFNCVSPASTARRPSRPPARSEKSGGTGCVAGHGHVLRVPSGGGGRLRTALPEGRGRLMKVTTRGVLGSRLVSVQITSETRASFVRVKWSREQPLNFMSTSSDGVSTLEPVTPILLGPAVRLHARSACLGRAPLALEVESSRRRPRCCPRRYDPTRRWRTVLRWRRRGLRTKLTNGLPSVLVAASIIHSVLGHMPLHRPRRVAGRC